MGNTYTGQRYVPKVHGINDPWVNTKAYESLEVVIYQGASFTSRQYVPVGVDINNEDFWTCTGNYNVQVEQYRQDSNNAVENVNEKLDEFANTQDGKFQIMLNQYKSQINAYADGKYNDIDGKITAINNNVQDAEDNLNAKMSVIEQNIDDTVEGYIQTVNNQITQVEQILTSIDIVYDSGTSTDPQNDDITIFEGGVA